MNKKKNLIYLVLLLLIFCCGFISYKNQFFPYQVIKFFKQKLVTKNNLEIKNLKEEKIKKKYKNWNKLNPNFKEIFIK